MTVPQFFRRLRLTPLVALISSVSFVSLVFVVSSYVPHVLPVDFLVYRDSSAVTLARGDLYRENLMNPELGPSGMPFTYTPFAAVALLWAALLPWRLTFALWTASSLLIVGLLAVRFHDWRGNAEVRWGHVAAFWIMCSTTIAVQHLVYGQINLALMAMVLGDILLPSHIRGQRRPVGILVGIAAATKLTPALFIVYFLVTRQWRAVAWSSVTFVAAAGLGFLLLPQSSHQFWTDVVFHLSDRVDLTGDAIASSGNNSITGVITGLFGLPRDAAAPWILLAAAAGLTAAWYLHLRRDALAAMLVVGLLAPLLSPISWIHHWVYILPAALMAFERLRGAARFWFTAAMLVLTIPGPSFGDFIESDLPVFDVVAPLWRESLVISAVALIVVLSCTHRRRAGRWSTSTVKTPVAFSPMARDHQA